MILGACRPGGPRHVSTDSSNFLLIVKDRVLLLQIESFYSFSGGFEDFGELGVGVEFGVEAL